MFMTKKDRKIANQKAMIENRDKFIKDLKSERDMQKNSNKDLRNESEELRLVISKVATLAFTHLVGREKEALDKIKELVRDYQSTTSSNL